MRVDDPKSGSASLSRNRTISTYYHRIEKFGYAQIHLGNIAEKISRATDVEPHQIVVRLRAPGGEEKTLKEYLDDAKTELGKVKHASRFRVFRNSDGSIDAELRVETNEDFHDTLLALGDVTWPKTI